MLREGGGVEVALRVAGGVTGVRGGVTAVESEAAVRPFSTRTLLPFPVDEVAEEEVEGEFLFTKRRSTGS